jgi:hypothetical protein
MIRAGERVELHGLSSRPDLNGSQGIAIQYIPQKERWGVMIGGRPLSLRSENLELHRLRCSREQRVCQLIMRRVFFADHGDVVKRTVEFLQPPCDSLALAVEVMPARSNAERGELKASQVAVLGKSKADEEEFFRAYYGWRNVRSLSMYSVHADGASDYPDLVVFFDDASKGATNEVVTQSCIGPTGFLAELTGKCIRGPAVVLRQGEGTNNAVVNEFPMMAILWPSAEKYARNMAPAAPLSPSQLLDTLVFYQENEPITWSRAKESERMLKDGGCHIQPLTANDAMQDPTGRMPFPETYGLTTPCIVCGIVGCRLERHVPEDAPELEVIRDVDHSDSSSEAWVDVAADAQTSALLEGTAMHAPKCDSGTLALVITFSRQPRQFDLALRESAPGQLKEAADEELQPAWAHGARNLVLGLSEDVWNQAGPDIELNVRHVIVRAQDKDEVIAALEGRHCRKPKPGVPFVPVADPRFTELFRDDSDAEDEADRLLGSWQSNHGTYMVARSPDGLGIAFHESIESGDIGGVLKRSAMGWWEAEVRYEADGMDVAEDCGHESEDEVLGLFRVRMEADHHDVLLSQVILAGSQGWADADLVRSVRKTSTSWGAALRYAVESERIVHLNLEKNGMFLAGNEEEPLVTPRSDVPASAPGRLEFAPQAERVTNPRVWQRKEEA